MFVCSACLWSVAYSCALFILGQFVCSVSCRTVVCTCAVSHLSVLCSCAVYVCGQLCVYVLFESLFSCVFVCSVCLCSVECCVLSEFLVSCVHELCMSSSVMCLCALVSHWSIVCSCAYVSVNLSACHFLEVLQNFYGIDNIHTPVTSGTFLGGVWVGGVGGGVSPKGH